MNKEEDELVKNYQELKKKPNSNEGLNILKRLASQIKPILKNRHWTIKNLCEFFPANPNLLGINVNRGWKINLRLRPHFDETQFLEYEEILGTLLHEMAHIVRGPHDEQFYKLLEELKQETEVLMASGYKGEGFYSDGQHLGSRSVPRYLSKQVAASAAEKRLQTFKMLPVGGIRLGEGGTESPLLKNMTPAQRAASAAEKRLRDKIWCGGSVENEADLPTISSVVSSPVPSSATKRKSSSHNVTSTNTMNGKTAIAKKTRVTIDLTHIESLTTNDDMDGWTCPTCTFINKPLVLACQVCLSERPTVEDDDTPTTTINDVNSDEYWRCPQCTLMNEKKWQACMACAFVNLKYQQQ